MREPERVSRWFCIRCGGGHQSSECPTLSKVISNAPLETPSHNGPYQGTALVRVLPAGLMAEALPEFHKSNLEKKMFTCTCRKCGGEFKSKIRPSRNYYCSDKCRTRRIYRVRRK